MTTFDLLMALFFVVSLYYLFQIYIRYKDPFHPGIVIIPMCIYFYFFLPLKLLYDGALEYYFDLNDLIFPEFYYFFSMFALGSGLVWGSRHLNNPKTADPVDTMKLYRLGIFMGSIGFIIWWVLIFLNGGFGKVYSESYAAGSLAESGWVRETWLLTIGGILLCLPNILGSFKLTKSKLIIILILSMPFLIQAFLGARRGPTYQIAIVIIFGYYIFRNKRPPLTTVLVGSACLGLIMLFLVGNRDKIYLGSDFSFNYNLFDTFALKEGTGNEYISSSGFVLATEKSQGFDLGIRYVTDLFLRPIPKEILPNKYEILKSDAVDNENVSQYFGWSIASGSVYTLFGETFVEFGWFGLLLLWLIGFSLGKVWRNYVQIGSLKWKIVFIAMSQGLLFLVAQDIFAMLVPFLLIIVPVLVIFRFSRPTVEIHAPGGQRI